MIENKESDDQWRVMNIYFSLLYKDMKIRLQSRDLESTISGQFIVDNM